MMSPELLIKRLVTVFGEPKTNRPDALVAELMRILAGQRPDVLTLTGDLCIDLEEYWPRPATVHRHMLTAISRLSKQHAPPEHQQIPDDADELIVVTPGDPRYEAELAVAHPARIRMITTAGRLKVRREPQGPMKAQVLKLVGDVARRAKA